MSLLTDRSRQSFADEPQATEWKAKASVKKTEVTEEGTLSLSMKNNVLWEMTLLKFGRNLSRDFSRLREIGRPRIKINALGRFPSVQLHSAERKIYPTGKIKPLL